VMVEPPQMRERCIGGGVGLRGWLAFCGQALPNSSSMIATRFVALAWDVGEVRGGALCAAL